MFSETIRARTRGHRVGLETLAELRFVAKTHYFHNGSGQLKSKDQGGAVEAFTWVGLDGLGKVTPLAASRVGDARSVTMGLDSEDAEAKVMFAEQRTDVLDREIVFWGQFYDADLNPLDPKFHIQTVIGDRLRKKKQGPRQRGLELVAEDFFIRRRRSAHAVVSHADQQMRDPTATAFIYQPIMVDKILNLYNSDD